MPDMKRACLIYVTATEALRAPVKARLEAQGFDVCEVKADLEDALAAQEGATQLPAALADCIAQSDLCVFLLPEEAGGDGLIGAAAGMAGGLDKQSVCVVAGGREEYPAEIDDHASIVREDSERLDDAICGTEVHEAPDRSPAPDRKIDHIRCQ
jgi:3-hydroxyisobutyrate dehydrogenase-like beta-hydroxyacid dehydrogenase